MVNTIFILDKNNETAKILSANKQSRNTFWEDTYQQELATGAESFEFTCYADERVVEGVGVVFYYNQQYKMFTIMELEEEHSEGQILSRCYCEAASMELINQYVRGFTGDMNCIQFFQHILDNTGWRIGKYNASLEHKVATVNVDRAESIWSLIEDYKDIFECEINIRASYENGKITGKLIDVYADGELGTHTYKRLEYGRNVVGITKSKDLYDWATGIIVDVEGVSDITFSRANGDPFDKGAGDVILDYTNNSIYNNGRGYILGVYQGDEEDPRTACLEAWKELQKRAVPKFDYQVTTALTSDEYENLHLGDTVYVIDYGYTPALLLEARVGELSLSFTDKTQNSCTLTNYKEVKSKLLGAEYIKLTGTIKDVVNSFLPLGPDGIADGAIVDGKIDTIYYKEITSDIVSAGIGVFEELYAEGMTVVNADIEHLNAGYAEIGTIKAQVAEIDTLVSGHLSSDNIQSLILTADKVTVEDAFIKDAMIDTVNAGKITAGQLDTSLVTIGSTDGSMQINGSLQQFKDSSGKVRIQIGKDAQGNFTFALFSQDGNGVLIDETGIKEGAIGDGLIVDNMVSGDANISGDKLDISSVIEQINGNTTLINSSKIQIDEGNQTLEVAFESLKTKVDTIESITVNGDLSSVVEQVSSNTTAINLMQGEISSLISNTTITKENGQVVQLKDDYNSTKVTVNSNTTQIGSLTTTVDGVSSKQTSLEQDLDGFKLTVSDVYETKDRANTTYATKSELNQTSTDLTATFRAGYNQGVVNMNSEGITVTHSGTNGYTNMGADGFTTHHNNGYSTFTADGLFRYIESLDGTGVQSFRYKTVATTGTIAFAAGLNSPISVELPATFDHFKAEDITILFTFKNSFEVVLFDKNIKTGCL